MTSLWNIEQRLQSRVSSELRASPALWAEYRRETKARSLPLWQLLLGLIGFLSMVPMFVVMMPVMVAYAVVNSLGPDLALAVFGAVSTCASLLFATIYIQSLQRSSDVAVMSHLPVADSAVALRVWRRIELYFLPSVYVVAVIHGVAAFQLGLGVAGWALAMGLAVVQSALMIAVGTILAVHRPHGKYVQWFGVIAFVTIIMSSAALLQPNAIPPAAVADFLYVITPGGWVAGVLGRGFLQNAVQSWLGLPVAVGIIVATIPALRKLSSVYRVSRFELRQGQDVKAVCFEKEVQAGEDFGDANEKIDPFAELNELLDAESAPLSESEAEALVREGGFLRERPYENLGWMERLIFRRLTSRQRSIVEFFYAEETDSDAQWRTISYFLVMIAAVVVLLAPPGFIFMFMIGPIVAMQFFPTILGLQGFRQHQSGGTYVSHWSGFAIGFREAYQVLFRSALIRSTVLLAGLLIHLALWVGRVGFPQPIVWWRIAAGVFAVFIVLPSCMALFLLSNGFRLPEFRWRRIKYFLPPLVATVMLYAGLGLAIIGGGMPPGMNPETMLACGFAVLAGAALILRFYYESMHRRGLVDPVTLKLSRYDKQRIQYQEKQSQYRSREKVLRERYGRFWWLRPRLWRWSAGNE